MPPGYAKTGGSHDSESKGLQFISCRGCPIGAENLKLHGLSAKTRKQKRGQK